MTAARAGAAQSARRAGLPARMAAAGLVGRVVDEHRGLDALLDESSGNADYLALDERDRGLARAIAVTAIRHRGRIAAALSRMLDRPPPAKARLLEHILHIAAAQILFLDTPDSAAVDLAVTAASADSRTKRFAAMTNAVLRRLSREKESLLAAMPATAEVVFPAWLAAALRRDYGKANADAIAAAIVEEPALDLTPKPGLDPAEAMRLRQAMAAAVLPTGSWRLQTAKVPDLPGFAEGAWWVQDAASALPARMLGDVRGLEVADLCAAPGGKTAQLAAAGARVTAVDVSPGRMARLEANMARLSLNAELVTGDILTWEPGRRFDAVLLDAPCSSTGTLRRHPDVAWTKSPQDVEALAKLQAQLVGKAAALVKPGGRMVYSNCSLLKQEGENLVAGLLPSLGLQIEALREDEIAGTGGMINGQGALRTLPHHLPASAGTPGGIDGFFACRIRIPV